MKRVLSASVLALPALMAASIHLPAACGQTAATDPQPASTAGNNDAANPEETPPGVISLRTRPIPANRAAQTGASRLAAIQAAEARSDASPGAAATTNTTSTPGATSATSAVPSTELEAQRLAIWNSPDMMVAREWVMEYGRRSRQFNEQAAREYLARVEKLSPAGMRQWLNSLNERRTNLARSNEVTQSARQRAVDETFARLQAVNDARAEASRNQTEAAFSAQGQLQSQQQFAGQRGAIKQAGRSDYLWDLYYGRNYGARLAFPDRYTKIAAMYTLPGDLPASDPRNFLRDVPIDANGNITTPGAEVAGAAGVGPGAGPAVGAGAGGAP